MKFIIKNGLVIDHANNIEGFFDIVIENGKILEVRKKGANTKQKNNADEEIDAKGKVVVPGLIDIHVHLREPGFEYKETIQTGCEAGAKGGFTSLCCMPNTDPVNDNSSVTKYILSRAELSNGVNIFPIGAITKGLEGENLSEIGELKEAGVVAISDDGKPVMNSGLMRRAIEYAKNFNLPIISHCEDLSLRGKGVMNEGYISTLIGLNGIHRAVEEVMVAREIALAEAVDWWVHIAHVSTEGSVRMIRDAKSRGIKITAEVTPHHLVLTDEAVRSYDTNTKVNPPLRERRDVDALIEGLKNDTIDCIASDHAPHELNSKQVDFSESAFGISGLETSLPIVLTLVNKGIIDLKTIIKKMTISSAKILGLKKGSLSIGADADITILDLEKEYIIDTSRFVSKGKNSPFNGWKVKGSVWMTVVGGRIVYKVL